MQGYNYILKRKEYGTKLDGIRRKIEESGIDYCINDYGLFFKTEAYNAVIEIINRMEVNNEKN